MKKSFPRKRPSTLIDFYEPTFWEGHTKLPPKGRIQESLLGLGRLSAYVSELDDQLDQNAVFHLSLKKAAYEKDPNPVYLIEAFLIALENDLYPPLWALNDLKKAFTKYHSHRGRGGEKTLDHFMGFSGRKSPEQSFKHLLIAERDEILCLDVYKLIKWFGLSIHKAAEMVGRKLEATPEWNKTKFKVKTPDVDTIAQKFSRKWKKIFETHSHIGLEKVEVEKKAEFLKTFPDDLFERDDRGRIKPPFDKYLHS
jgi:hypothetical protein